MKEDKEKIKIEIERLKTKLDSLKFEHSTISNFAIGFIAILASVYIPIMIAIKNPTILIVIAVVFIIILLVIIFVERKNNSKNVEEIGKIYFELNKKYENLLK
jgi:hypothetical protein